MEKIFTFVLMILLGIVGCTTEETVVRDTQTRIIDEMVMMHVPEATFRLSEQGKDEDGLHEVKLDSFWIDQTEITNSHFKKCVATGDCIAPTTCAWGEPTFDDPAYEDHPVICVTWEMAASYCQWAGGRLPTEAEWDYAARGSKRTMYTWGNTFDEENLNFCDANCPKADTQYNDGYKLTAPVGTYPNGASWCGALDMNGNVWEWVADWYAPYTTKHQENPTGPTSGVERVIRGGSWYDPPNFLRADHRHPFNPNDNNHLIGFRCVLSAEGREP